MDKLSVVIITFNEARNIKRALTSVQEVADDIIVLDSFSTDETEAICKLFNVNFIQRKWGGYADQKNFANTQAKYDYILSLDADEALDDTLKQAVLNLKSNGFKDVYIVNRLVNYCGQWIKHSSWYPDKKIRIFPKSQTAWTGEFVHETLTFKSNFETIELPGHLEHYTYYSYEEHRERADKYSLLTAQKMHANGKTASLIKPYLSGLARFLSMYIIKLGFLDGYNGFKIAQISAKSNVYKYKTLRALNHGH